MCAVCVVCAVCADEGHGTTPPLFSRTSLMFDHLTIRIKKGSFVILIKNNYVDEISPSEWQAVCCVLCTVCDVSAFCAI